jgi:hypothetical protein
MADRAERAGQIAAGQGRQNIRQRDEAMMQMDKLDIRDLEQEARQ